MTTVTALMAAIVLFVVCFFINMFLVRRGSRKPETGVLTVLGSGGFEPGQLVHIQGEGRTQIVEITAVRENQIYWKDRS